MLEHAEWGSSRGTTSRDRKYDPIVAGSVPREVHQQACGQGDRGDETDRLD